MEVYVSSLGFKDKAKLKEVATKFKYEIVLPEDVKVDKDEFIQVGKSKGFIHYQTDDLREYVDKLENA